MTSDWQLAWERRRPLRSMEAITICIQVLDNPTRVGDVVRILHHTARQQVLEELPRAGVHS